MFKLTVEQILASIEALTAEERLELQRNLSKVLGDATTQVDKNSRQAMSNTVSGVAFGGNNAAFNFSPVQNEGGTVTASPNFAQTTGSYQELLAALEHLKQKIRTAQVLDPLQKVGAEAGIEQIEIETKKQEPNKGLIAHTVSALKQGLEGVQDLAEPVMTVASLVAKAWGITV